MVENILKAINEKEFAIPKKTKLNFNEDSGSLNKFFDSYGTKTKCREAFFHLRWAKGTVCTE